MKHIALFLPDLKGGGAERVMLTLAKYFAGRGHRVDLVLARAEGALLPLVADGVRVVDLRARLSGWGLLGLALSATMKLTGYLHREKPNVLLSTLTGANLVAVVARRLSRRAVRLVLREAVTLKNLKSLWRLWLMRWLYPQADVMVVLTEVMRQQMISVVGVLPSKLACISNPVDVDFIRSRAAMSLDHPWFVPGSPPVILGIGRLSQQKDFATLIRAIAELRSRGFESHLVILGEGPLREELEKLIKKKKLGADVILPGFDDNPYRWLARSRVLVLSSLWEGYPNVVLEAKALGIPIISTEYDASIHELLDNSAAIVPVGDVEALAEAIAISLQYQLAEFQHQCQDHLQQNYIIAAYLNVLFSPAD